MRNRFVTAAEPLRLSLVDVYIRAHSALVERKAPEATAEEIANSQARVDAAIEDNAWIEIKPELSAGETRTVESRYVSADPAAAAAGNARLTVNFRKVGFTKIAMYLLAWNIEDDRGVVDIPSGDDDADLEARERLIERLDQQTFTDMLAAIEYHEAEVLKRRNGNPTTARSSKATSESRG